MVLLLIVGMAFLVLILGSALAHHLPDDSYFDDEGPCEDDTCYYDDANDICLDCGWSRTETTAYQENICDVQ